MQFSLDQHHFSTAIDLVSRAVPTKPALPILSCILLVADEDSQSLRLTGYDVSIGIRTEIPATVKTGGSICLPAALLSALVSKLQPGSIDLSIANSEATLNAGGGEYKLSCLEADEYPTLPTPTDTPLAIPTELLLSGLRSVLPTASGDETKQILTGVKIIGTADEFEFAATDGHRLSIVRGQAVDGAIDFVLPGKAAGSLIKMLENKDAPGSIDVVIEGSQILFDVGGQSIVSRLLDGQYPDYPRLLPKLFSGTATVDRKGLVSALERIAIIADQKNNVVKIQIETDAMVISAEAPDVGTASEAVPMQFHGEGSITIAFNVKYLLNGLKSMATQEIQLQMNSPAAPVVIRPIGGLDSVYLLMPVAIRS
jgi:DNA polymerase III subunit beta